MKIVAQRLIVAKLGDSKIGIHKINELENFILTIQDINSANIVIVGKENEEYKVLKDEEGNVGQYILINDVEYNQLNELGKLLLKEFPNQEKEE